ncbi:MAG: hypothetical protein ACAH95_17980 [Fimbriimonas sp.]
MSDDISWLGMWQACGSSTESVGVLGRRMVVLASLLTLPLALIVSSWQADETKQLFDYLDQAGYGAIATAPIIALDPNGGKGNWYPVAVGFKISGSGGREALLLPGLRTLPLDSPLPVGHQIKEIDVHTWLLERKSFMGPDTYDPTIGGHWDGYLKPLVAVTLARAARARRFNQLSDEFVDLAHTLNGKTPLLRLLQETIPRIALSDIVQDVTHPTLPRSVPLQRLEDFLKRFPDSKQADEAREAEETLRKMVNQERIRPKRDAESLPVKEKIDELIYQLSDQKAAQYMSPGGVEVFPFGSLGSDDSPAYKLRSLGLEAVRALLDATGDRRFIRGGQSRFAPSFGGAMRVGGAAWQIIEEIAHRSFVVSGRRSHAEARAWLAEVEAKGWRQVLNEGVRRGDVYSASQAYQLKIEFPEDLIASVEAGLKRTHFEHVRQGLYYALRGLRDPRAIAILKSEAGAGRPLGGRVAAAEVLAHVDRSSATEFLIKAWHALPLDKLLSNSEESASYRLPNLLIESYSLSAAEALRNTFPTLPADLKLGVLTSAARAVAVKQRLPQPHPSVEEEPAFIDVLKDMLGTALTDRTRLWGAAGHVGEYQYSSPRLADIAAAGLAVLDPKLYSYKKSASPAEREAFRLNNLRRWHAAAGRKAILDVRWQVPKASGNTVSAVEFEGMQLSRPVMAEAKGLVGRPLSGHAFLEVFLKTDAGLITPSGNLEVRAEREADGSGILLIFHLATAPPGEETRSARYLIRSATQSLSSSSYNEPFPKEIIESLTKEIDLALSKKGTLEVIIDSTWRPRQK